MTEREELDYLRDEERQYCLDNPVYYIENYGHYEDKDAAELIQPFKLWPMQKDALTSIHKNRKNVILKARQLGISWLVVNYASSYLALRSGRTVIGLSRTEEEAKELVRRMDVVLSNMPEFILPSDKVPAGWTGPVYTKSALKIEVKWPNGQNSIFQCFPSSPGATRSFTADLVIFDEWAYQDHAEDIWASAFPVINRPFGGKFIGLSTNKRGTLFEKTFTDEDNGFNKIFLPWYADPSRDDKWYQNTVKTYGLEATRLDYPSTVEEALEVVGGCMFPEVTEESIKTDVPLKGNVVTYFVMDYGLDRLAAYWIQTDGRNDQIVKEVCESNLTISAAAERIIEETEWLVAAYGASFKPFLYLAPPDLWNRSQETGKSRALIFAECGLNLTKSNNNIADGVAAMKEYLRHADGGQSRLTILNDCAPELFNCLRKIQIDKRRPNIYAKDPHELTHGPDALRYYCIYWIINPNGGVKEEKRVEWREDQWEDYNNASEEDRAYLRKIWGNPY